MTKLVLDFLMVSQPNNSQISLVGYRELMNRANLGQRKSRSVQASRVEFEEGNASRYQLILGWTRAGSCWGEFSIRLGVWLAGLLELGDGRKFGSFRVDA